MDKKSCIDQSNIFPVYLTGYFSCCGVLMLCSEIWKQLVLTFTPESRDIQLVVFSFSAVQHPYVYPARLSVGTPGERPPDAPRLPDEFLSSGRYRRICGYKRSSVPPHRPDRAFLDLALPSDPHRDQRRRSLLSKAPKRYKEYSLLPQRCPGLCRCALSFTLSFYTLPVARWRNCLT